MNLERLLPADVTVTEIVKKIMYAITALRKVPRCFKYFKISRRHDTHFGTKKHEGILED